MAAMMILLFSEFIANTLNAPPRDLAALLAPEQVLTQMDVAQDEASLIAVLKSEKQPLTDEEIQQALNDITAQDGRTRQRAVQILMRARERAMPFLTEAAQSDDAEKRTTALNLLTQINNAMGRPFAEPDMDYVKKLFAIRLLEKTKSAAALPTLKSIAEGDDITLAEAAREAIATINGEEIAPPAVKDALAEIAKRLPDNAGFAAVLDISRNRKLLTIRDIITPMLQAPQVQSLLEVMGRERIEAELNQIPREAESDLPEVLSMLGNLRVDGVVMLTSDNLPDRTGYAAWIFKGLCDPERLRGFLAKEVPEDRQVMIGDHTVFYDPGDFAVCVLDEHTMVITVTPYREQTLAMRVVLMALDRKEERPVPENLAPAFDAVLNEGHMLAASGSLSDLQKATIAVELEKELTRMKERMRENPRPDRLLEMAACELMLNLEGVDLFTATLGDNAAITVKAMCATQESVALLNASLTNFQKILQTMIAQATAQMPPETKATLGLDEPDADIWIVMVEDKTLTATVNIGTLTQRLGAMAMGERMQRRRRPAAEEEARRREMEIEARLAAENARQEEAAQRAKEEALRKQAEEEARRKAEERARQEAIAR